MPPGSVAIDCNNEVAASHANEAAVLATDLADLYRNLGRPEKAGLAEEQEEPFRALAEPLAPVPACA